MARSMLAACLVFAGVWLLAGAGWALLAGGFLVFGLWPQGAETALSRPARVVAERARRVAGWAAGVPRRAVAVGGMGGGLALVPAGLGLWIGLGAAVVAAGGLLIGLSLLAGQGA